MLEKLMSEEIKLATAPVSWGVDHMGRPDLPAWPVSHDIPVSRMIGAIQDARQGKAMKILVRPEE